MRTMELLKEWLPLLNVVLLPILIGVIRIERRLTRLETIEEIRRSKKSHDTDYVHGI